MGESKRTSTGKPRAYRTSQLKWTRVSAPQLRSHINAGFVELEEDIQAGASTLHTMTTEPIALYKNAKKGTRYLYAIVVKSEESALKGQEIFEVLISVEPNNEKWVHGVKRGLYSAKERDGIVKGY